MTIRYDRPVSRSAFLSLQLGFFSAGMLVLVVLAHRFGPLKAPDFIALVLLSGIPAALAVPLALIGLARLWSVGALGGISALKALIYASIPLALIGFGAFRYFDRPPIYDVSTDLIDPPEWLAVPDADQRWLTRPPVTGASRELQYAAYPGLTGRRYDGALDRVYEAVRKVVGQDRLEIVASRGQEYALPEFQPQAAGVPEEEDAGALPHSVPVPQPRPEPQVAPVSAETEPEGTVRIQAKTRTLILGLPFDALIRLREEEEMTLVDVRVESRYGPHDLGMGAEIAEHFLHMLDAELLGVAGD
ncbi:hypothetical protein ACO34A_08415 [Rhizobium sp. ACO-34A]|nr:DUF1499 domain-containing protein [Rhizobium sp. ACO-34A]ATN33833.1 hypothetical protein ACO34A_08415 [Rhizobium sp. ACO-34A]